MLRKELIQVCKENSMLARQIKADTGKNYVLLPTTVLEYYVTYYRNLESQNSKISLWQKLKNIFM